jgi:hypothetical protein
VSAWSSANHGLSSSAPTARAPAEITANRRHNPSPL